MKNHLLSCYKLYALVFIFLNLIPTLHCQDKEWSRVAQPGYTDYAPVTLANGVYGLTMSEKAFSGNQLQMNGVFDFFPEQAAESAIRGIDFTDLDLIVMDSESADTEQADFGKGISLSKTELEDLENWRQEFNFKQGSFKTDFTFNKLEVSHTAYVLHQMSQTGIIKLTFKAREDLVFSLKNTLEMPDPYTFSGSAYLNQLRMRRVPLFTAQAESPGGRYKIATTTSFYFEGEEQPLIEYENRIRSKPNISFKKHLKKGESFTCYLIGSMLTSYNYSNPEIESAQLNIYTYLKGPEKVINEHINEWAEFWNSTDIIVEGDSEATKDIRQMMYFINSFVRPNTDFSSACMGLGTDYWGYKILWDADFWIYPALLLINPDAARSMLEYRWKRLEMAKQNAMTHGYKGAMFPWESGHTGEDQTSLMYLTGPFQHHITADVGLAFWYYYCVTQDKEWLFEKAYPMLKEVADFWLSRVEINENGEYDILNVVSPDEHAINVDNDVFTNAAVKSVLEAATEAAQLAGETPTEQWKEVADGLVFNTFNNGVYREHGSYNGEVIKQAATNLASFPLDVIKDRETIILNLNYYEKKVDPHGPNMTWPMYAGAAARAGDPEKAKLYFDKALQSYKKGPFKIIALRPYLNTTFFGTASGGILQAMILGFGGIHFSSEGLKQVDPVLPKEWKSIRYKGIGSGETFVVEE